MIMIQWSFTTSAATCLDALFCRGQGERQHAGKEMAPTTYHTADLALCRPAVQPGRAPGNNFPMAAAHLAGVWLITSPGDRPASFPSAQP